MRISKKKRQGLTMKNIFYELKATLRKRTIDEITKQNCLELNTQELHSQLFSEFNFYKLL